MIFVFAVSLFVCSLLAALHDDEVTHRLETLFALPYGRARWLQGRTAVAFAAVALCALAAGLGVGIGAGVTGAHLSMAQALEAGVNVLPTEALFLGAGLLLFALTPRYGVGLGYALVIVAFVLELFGALLSLPGWALDLSPFHHVAPAPAKPIAVTSALVMGTIGVSAAAAAIALFRQRDLAGD